MVAFYGCKNMIINNVIYYINKLKDIYHIITSLNLEKDFGKVQHFFKYQSLEDTMNRTSIL